MSNNSPSPSAFWGGSGRGRSFAPQSSIDPPRPAKDRFEWVWFPEGYWAERPLPPQSPSKQQGKNSSPGPIVGKMFKWSPRLSSSPLRLADLSESEQSDPSPSFIQHPVLTSLPPFTLPKNLPQSPYLSEQAQVASLQQPMNEAGFARGSRDTWQSLGPANAPGALLSPSDTKPPSRLSSRVSWMPLHRHKEPGETGGKQRGLSRPHTPAEAVPGYFEQKPIPAPSISTPAVLPAREEDDNTAAETIPKVWPRTHPKNPINLRNWFRKTHRTRRPPESPGTESVTGSSRERTIGGSSASSQAGSLKGFSNRPVLLAQTQTTTSYPAGEAMHVETPPLKQWTASGKPRSFFMDIKHPIPLDDDSSNSSVPSTTGASRVQSYRNGQTPEKREWWDAPKAPPKRDVVKKDVSVFEFDLAEHLPNSPMCPANPKHTGKGKGVCVYHGRAKVPSQEEGSDGGEEDEDLESP